MKDAEKQLVKVIIAAAIVLVLLLITGKLTV